MLGSVQFSSVNRIGMDEKRLFEIQHLDIAWTWGTGPRAVCQTWPTALPEANAASACATCDQSSDL